MFHAFRFTKNSFLRLRISKNVLIIIDILKQRAKTRLNSLNINMN